MTKIDDEEILQSKTIDFLRFPLAVAVVFIHSFGQPSEYVLPDWDIETIDIYNLIRITFSHVLSHIAVPIFFFISGFLFFYKVKIFNLSVYKKKLSKRFKTILVPYILWNIIVILGSVIGKIGAYLLNGQSLSSIFEYFESNGWMHLFWDNNKWAFDRVDWLGNTLIAMSGPCNLPLWFLRDLMMVILLSPLIYFLIKSYNKYVILILFFCYISNIFPQIQGLNITGVFFFTSGAFFSITHKNIITTFNKYQIISLLLAVILLVGTIIYDGKNTLEGQYIYPFYIIFGSISAFNISSCLIRKKNCGFPSVLSQSSFFIYAIHTILILSVADKICSFIFFNSITIRYFPNTILLITNYIFTPILAVTICLGIYIFMNKFMPRLLSLLTGNR